MNPYQRIFLFAFIALLAVAGVGVVVTSDWGHRATSVLNHASGTAQSPVDLGQFRTAQTLAVLAATPEEQDRARDALRMADHEVDFAFASALYQASSQPVPSTPEIKGVLERISAAEKNVADLDLEIARLTKLIAGAKGNQKDALSQQLDLAKARQELNEDELADADQDLERVGGDPRGRVQRMVDAYSASEPNGQVDLTIVGRQASSTLPVSNSLLSRARAWYALHSLVGRLHQAEQEANTAITRFTNRHDELEHQIEQAQSQQSKKLAAAPSGGGSGRAPAGAASSASDQTNSAISSFRSLTALQKRLSGLDSRIHNLQDLAAAYGQWSALSATRSRNLLHALFISFALMLLIGLAALIANRLLDRTFDRLEPDRKRLLTLRAVAHIATRAIGIILILLLIFGPPNQTATVLALAGAGLTVALKDFIVGFFGWFVLMGKNGIRHGDWVEINGVSGEVVEIGLFRTVLLETGNWADSGHPTGRRVTFVNSYAIEGHYFNFSTSGQWLWDELQIAIPADQDPYPIADEIQKIVAKETETDVRLAGQEWSRLGNVQGTHSFSAGPAIIVRPANLSYEISVRYVTRANERHQRRSKLYFDIVELLRRKNIPQPATPPPPASPAAASA